MKIYTSRNRATQKAKNWLAAFCATFLIAGCSTPVQYSKTPLSPYDKHTDVGFASLEDGFEISILYSRYQYIPESAAVATACKAALTSIAWEYAQKQNKRIEPVNDQRIRLSMGRNGLTGVTSCAATAAVKWQ